ncbi:MAG: hypothetical protein QM709_04325 [Spongiibacteraceae bacterium]
MNDRKNTTAKKANGVVRVPKKDRKNLSGKTKWALLAEEQKRDTK